MNCERVKALFPDVIAGTLEGLAKTELEAHLKNCPACARECSSLQSVWAQLSSLPNRSPDLSLDARVDATIKAYARGLQRSELQADDTRQWFSAWLWSALPKGFAFQFVAAVLFFALGFFASLGITGNRAHTDGVVAGDQQGITQLREEVANMKRLLTLSLLEQPSASERLRGVQWSSRSAQPDGQVLSGLLRVVELDPSVNVRLAAVNALGQFINNPRARDGLVEVLSRSHSQSPSVQIDLIDAMVRANEKGSVAAIRSLLLSPDLDPTVREHAEWALQKLS